MPILVNANTRVVCQGITGSNGTHPSYRHPGAGWGTASCLNHSTKLGPGFRRDDENRKGNHPSEGWGPGLLAQQRDASRRWHDGVGGLEFSHSYTYTV